MDDWDFYGTIGGRAQPASIASRIQFRVVAPYHLYVDPSNEASLLICSANVSKFSFVFISEAIVQMFAFWHGMKPDPITFSPTDPDHPVEKG